MVSTLIVLFTAAFLSADTMPYEKELLKGIDRYLDYDFSRADSIFSRICRQYPDDPRPLFYRVVNRNADYRSQGLYEQGADTLFRDLPGLLKKFHEFTEIYPDYESAYLYWGTARALKSRVYMSRGKYLPALREGLLAIRYAEKAAEMDPEYVDTKLALGTFDIFLSVVLEHYSFLRPVIGGEDYRQLGLNRLKDAFYHGCCSRGEAGLLLLMTYLYEEEDASTAAELADSLSILYPGNMEIRALACEANLLLDRYETARGHLTDMEISVRERFNSDFADLWSRRIDYLNAIAGKQRGEEKIAEKLFHQVIDGYDLEFGWQCALSWYYLAEIYENNGELQKAAKALKYCIETKEVTKTVLNAEKMLDKMPANQ